ncbi:MAG TPA: sulfite exporter TauE/SafE family protein [Thermoanaerobaculia bacterium]|nr:sulfite exporter TauE/SafE family protein [Thermoanaerobaculia bacterium]
MDQQTLVDLAMFGLAGFIAQMIDGMCSMGYGVSATSLLLTFGVAPAAASASVHTAEVVATGFSAYNHWKVKNVVWEFTRKLLIPGAIGAILGAYVLTRIPGDAIKPWVAAYLLVMGLVILYKAFRPRPTAEPHAHIVPLGLAGGFFDSIGGGGWGPIVAGTLLARGNTPRTTIGSVAFAEFFVTVASSATLLLTIGVSNWVPIAGLALGSAIAAPIAARLTGRIPAKPLMIIVALVVIALSVRTIVRTL